MRWGKQFVETEAEVYLTHDNEVWRLRDQPHRAAR